MILKLRNFILKRKKKLDQVHIEAIKGWIDNDYGLTLKFMKSKILQDFGITVSKKTVDNYIASFSYTLKRIALIPERRNNEKNI